MSIPNYYGHRDPMEGGEAPEPDDDPDHGPPPHDDADAPYRLLRQLDAMRGVIPTHKRCRHGIDLLRADCGICYALDIMLSKLEVTE